jgi:hypothetical protein
MMLGACLGHSLDDELPVLGDIHLDTASHAHATWSLGRLVNCGQRILQADIGCDVVIAFDEEALFVHDLPLPQVDLF